jgi:hypothetical protein
MIGIITYKIKNLILKNQIKFSLWPILFYNNYMKNKFFFLIPFLAAAYFFGCSTKEVVKERPVEIKIDSLRKVIISKNLPVTIPNSTKLEKIAVDDRTRSININLSKEFSYFPFREENVKNIYSLFKAYFGDKYQNYTFHIKTMGYDIEELIPNFYRAAPAEYDFSRIPSKKNYPDAVIRNISKKYFPSKGLLHRNIVLWPSHGWYYENKEGRWKWQRPRLFQTVEDLLPFSFTDKYLIPMLENAGANVFTPRERDTQKNEVVVDNDSYLPGSYIEESHEPNHFWKQGLGEAFGYGKPPYPSGLNPFKQGTFRMVASDSVNSADISWIPKIPETGYYSVYISYASSPLNITDAHYTVFYAGGAKEFLVNQQIGGKTWEYLGEFKFFKGYHPSTGKVVLSNKSRDLKNKIVSADAVRFGGGMGLITRGGTTSGRPKFTEAARYWLQYAGMPDSLVYDLNENQNDYNDDYQGRGEYVNYLYGAQFGPNKNRKAKGLRIPIDLSLALHTDAGIKNSDTTFGTMAIYSIEDFDTSRAFPDGVSRLANRDLADIVQTQIVDDIHSNYDSTWFRRILFNSKYSEAARPNVPSILIELLSHQNFLDMKYALDPRFQFDVSRSIYKGILKFLSVQYGFNYIVQPLPVTHFSTSLNNDTVTLKWEPAADPIEPTALPEKYIVYTRIDSNGFNSGEVSDKNEMKILIAPEKIYSFKVTAVNEGGESFPSEILAVCREQNDRKPVLIVNGFNRVAPPASISEPNYSGFLNYLDPGLPYKNDVSFTGRQYDFNPASSYISNDAPGHGASHADYETKIIAGNSFDFPYIHGESLKSSGFSFVSSSLDAAMDSLVNLKEYKFVDLILGEEKSTHRQSQYIDSTKGEQFQTFPGKLIQKIEDYCSSGGNIFISGSYVGSDLFFSRDSSGIKFENNCLKFNFDAGHASRTGKVHSVNTGFSPEINFQFNVDLNDSIYAVEAPDAITNTYESQTILRYSENEFGAGVAFKKNYGVIVFGFPFETVLKIGDRNKLMKSILSYFKLF